MSDHIRQLMHEKLDGVLSDDLTEELYRHLSQDNRAAEEYAQLENVDNLLSRAPVVRAPQRLAVTIMARLAQSIEAQAKLNDLPETVRQAVMTSLSLTMVSMMPMMVGASWMVIHAMADASLLTRVLERVVFLMHLVVQAQLILIEEIERVVKQDPELAAAALTLLPAMMEGLLDYIEGDEKG